jgi:hypothetical protein
MGGRRRKAESGNLKLENRKQKAGKDAGGTAGENNGAGLKPGPYKGQRQQNRAKTTPNSKIPTTTKAFLAAVPSGRIPGIELRTRLGVKQECRLQPTSAKGVSRSTPSSYAGEQKGKSKGGTL